MNAAAAALSQPVICVVGPTASGKTDVAQLIATRLDGEVVSADSMQVYRGMDIGTGKLPESERLVPHYGFDLVDPGEPFSAALFQAYARESFVEIESKGKRSILAFTYAQPSMPMSSPIASKSIIRSEITGMHSPQNMAPNGCGVNCTNVTQRVRS